jgi:sugar phosphate isomerase/epimerase
MTIRYGVTSGHSQDWLAFLETAAQCGFAHVELRAFDAEPEAPIYDPRYLEAIRGFTRTHGMRLSVHVVSGINLAEKLPRLRRVSVDILLGTMEAAEYLGADWVTVHLGSAGFNNDSQQKRKRLDLAAESLRTVLEETKGMCVNLAVENLVRIPADKRHCRMGDSPADFAYLFECLASERLRTVFDLGHSVVESAEADALSLLEALSGRLIGMHVHWNHHLHDEHGSVGTEALRECPRLLDRTVQLIRAGTVPVFESFSMGEVASSLEFFQSLS